MKDKLYAIIDIETTGGRASRDKITEIAIVLYDGEQIIDTYETLVNPECYIPYGITQLTGITQEMVNDAPKFYEVARKVVEMTEGAVFVAHNVRFDYSFIRAEFEQLGFTFTRKQLCTVRLSRQAYPHLSSHSLDSMIRFLKINIQNRHRAMGDAMATTELLRQILAQEESQENIHQLVNLGIKEALLPKNITLDTIHALPEKCGVYYFHNEKGDVVYVGKSINIKNRVAEHFRDKTEKASKLQKSVYDITFELTGSELIALLLESAEIKRLRPPINRAQRIRKFPFVIHQYHNEEGYICIEAAQVTAVLRKKLNVISEYPKLSRAKGYLSAAWQNYELCSRFCGLQKGSGTCFHFHLKQCHGACAGVEPPETYNERAQLAVDRLSTVFEEDFFLLDHGRTNEEYAVVLVKEGSYQGYGYLDQSDLNGQLDILYDVIKPFVGNPETTRIIQRYMSKNTQVKVLAIKQKQ